MIFILNMLGREQPLGLTVLRHPILSDANAMEPSAAALVASGEEPSPSFNTPVLEQPPGLTVLRHPTPSYVTTIGSSAAALGASGEEPSHVTIIGSSAVALGASGEESSPSFNMPELEQPLGLTD